MEKPVLTQLLENKYTLLAIPCEDRTQRALLHRYVEQRCPTLGSRSFQHPDMPTEKTTYRIHHCFDEEEKLVEVTYSCGFEENNRDEFYTGDCNVCGHLVHWEPNYDEDYESTITVERGNMLLIGFVLQGMQKTRVDHSELSKQQIQFCEEFLNSCPSFKLSLQIDGLKFISNPKVKVNNLKQLLEWVIKQVV